MHLRDTLRTALLSVNRRTMSPFDGRWVVLLVGVLAGLPSAVVCPQPSAVANTAGRFTGFWEVVLEDANMLAMIYSDPTTTSSPLALVPSGSVLRGVEDWCAPHRQLAELLLLILSPHRSGFRTGNLVATGNHAWTMKAQYGSGWFYQW